MKAKLFRMAATVLALTLAVSMTACGGTKKTAKKTSSKESASSKQVESVEETPSEEEPSSEEPSSEESSAQQPSSQAPAAPSQQKSVSPEEAAKNMSPPSKTLRLRDLTEAELQIVANAMIKQINSKVQMCNGGHELTPDSDLNKIAHYLNGLQSSGALTGASTVPDSVTSLPEMKPFLYAYVTSEPEQFDVYFGKDNWNQTEVTVSKDYLGGHTPFDALIDGTGDIDLAELGNDYGFNMWDRNVSLDNDYYRYIGASADIINGQLYVTVICATSKTGG